MLYYFNSKNPSSTEKISILLKEMVSQTIQENQDIILLCIGSDRSTGDSLGPLTGYLSKRKGCSNIHIIGDLMYPVHASNLDTYLKNINVIFNNPFIIAVDASLGTPEHIGYITLAKGPLKPGLGVKKKLPEVGNIHITGIVNSSSKMNYSTLQTTRLSLIFRISDIISDAIIMFNDDYYKQPLPEKLYLPNLISL